MAATSETPAAHAREPGQQADAIHLIEGRHHRARGAEALGEPRQLHAPDRKSTRLNSSHT